MSGENVTEYVTVEAGSESKSDRLSEVEAVKSEVEAVKTGLETVNRSVVIKVKTCTSCKQDKSLTEFSPKQGRCKTCRKTKIYVPKRSEQYYWLILNGSTVKNLVEELKISLRQAYFLTKNCEIYQKVNASNLSPMARRDLLDKLRKEKYPESR